MPQDCPDLLTCAARNGKLKRLDGRLVPSAGPTASHPVHGGGATDGTRRRRHGYSLYRRAVEFSRITRAWSNSLSARRSICRSGQRSGVFLALPTWDILQEGKISLTWHHGHPERREKNRSLWSRESSRVQYFFHLQ